MNAGHRFTLDHETGALAWEGLDMTAKTVVLGRADNLIAVKIAGHSYYGGLAQARPYRSTRIEVLDIESLGMASNSAERFEVKARALQWAPRGEVVTPGAPKEPMAPITKSIGLQVATLRHDGGLDFPGLSGGKAWMVGRSYRHGLCAIKFAGHAYWSGMLGNRYAPAHFAVCRFASDGRVDNGHEALRIEVIPALLEFPVRAPR